MFGNFVVSFVWPKCHLVTFWVWNLTGCSVTGLLQLNGLLNWFNIIWSCDKQKNFKKSFFFFGMGIRAYFWFDKWDKEIQNKSKNLFGVKQNIFESVKCTSNTRIVVRFSLARSDDWFLSCSSLPCDDLKENSRLRDSVDKETDMNRFSHKET